MAATPSARTPGWSPSGTTAARASSSSGRVPATNEEAFGTQVLGIVYHAGGLLRRARRRRRGCRRARSPPRRPRPRRGRCARRVPPAAACRPGPAASWRRTATRSQRRGRSRPPTGGPYLGRGGRALIRSCPPASPCSGGGGWHPPSSRSRRPDPGTGAGRLRRDGHGGLRGVVAPRSSPIDECSRSRPAGATPWSSSRRGVLDSDCALRTAEGPMVGLGYERAQRCRREPFDRERERCGVGKVAGCHPERSRDKGQDPA